MPDTDARSLLQSAAGSLWNQDGVETLGFDDPNDINAGGTAFLYGDSGVVRLELSLPAHKAAEVIRFVRGEQLTLPRGAIEAPVYDELAALIAEQAADDASGDQ